MSGHFLLETCDIFLWLRTSLLNTWGKERNLARAGGAVSMVCMLLAATAPMSTRAASAQPTPGLEQEDPETHIYTAAAAAAVAYCIA